MDSVININWTGLTGLLGLFFFSSFQMKLEKPNPPAAENF
jgi:hypothetical protein